jgi:Cd2+/Zn2+-exporting ATPase
MSTSNTSPQRERHLVAGQFQVIKGFRTWFDNHGEMTCAIISGVLLAVAFVLTLIYGDSISVTPHKGTVPSLPGAYYTYHTMVYLAFGLGFFFGAGEAWEALREGKLDIHFLMVAGAVASIFLDAEMEGAVLLFLFTLSGALEHYAMQRTHAALESLMKLFPKEAILIDSAGQQTKVKLSELKIDDHILIRPGENIAADGIVIEGRSAIDESAITGEYLPREKGVGAEVFAGTLNNSGRLVVKVSKLAGDTTLARIIHLVTQAREEKAPVEQLFEKIGTPYTIGVLVLSISSALILHYFFGLPWVAPEGASPISGAFYRAITLLIVASPCALIISTPVVLLSAIATCARRGVVLKGGRHLESLAQLKALVFDKTGTLTTGQVRLSAVEFVDSRHAPLHCDWPAEGTGKAEEDEKPDTTVMMSSTLRQEFASDMAKVEAQLCAKREIKIGCTVLRHGEPDVEKLLLKVAAALEVNSTHPLAKAVVKAAHEAQINIPAVEQFVQEPGVGLRGVVEGESAILGSPNLLTGLCQTLSVNRLCKRVQEIEAQGQTAVVIYYGGLAGILSFQDTLRPEAKATVDQLHALGVRPLVMLTGDHQKAAEGVAQAVGIDEVRAELMPQDKLKHVEELVAKYKVVGMVGDGINDAPALARATVGIAMGSIGSDAAMQAADVVLLSDRIERLPWLIRTAQKSRRVMMQNLIFAMLVILVLAIFTVLGEVKMSLGVLGHEGSTVLVVFNGLRLLMNRQKD